MTKEGGHEVAEQPGNVDAHVEDLVARIDQLAAVLVEFPEHGADVRLEQTVTENDEPEADEEGDRSDRGQEEVADHHEEGAEQDRSAEAEDSFGQHGSEEGGYVAESEKRSVDLGRKVFGIAEASLDGVHQEEGEKTEHEVEAPALPHLNREEPLKGPWVPFGSFRFPHDEPPSWVKRTLCQSLANQITLT